MSTRADLKAKHDDAMTRARGYDRAARLLVILIGDNPEGLTAQDALNELRAAAEGAREIAAQADAEYHGHLIGTNTPTTKEA